MSPMSSPAHGPDWTPINAHSVHRSFFGLQFGHDFVASLVINARSGRKKASNRWRPRSHFHPTNPQTRSNPQQERPVTCVRWRKTNIITNCNLQLPDVHEYCTHAFVLHARFCPSVTWAEGTIWCTSSIQKQWTCLDTSIAWGWRLKSFTS